MSTERHRSGDVENGSGHGANTATPGVLRILVAEDDPINQKVAEGMLRRIACHCDFVETGAEAIAALMRTPYDLVLMDIQMPVMDGVEATRQIRLIDGPLGKTPIIAMTAHAMQGDREKYIAAGMDDYVSKPIDSDRLIAAVSHCTKRSEAELGLKTSSAVA